MAESSGLSDGAVNSSPRRETAQAGESVVAVRGHLIARRRARLRPRIASSRCLCDFLGWLAGKVLVDVVSRQGRGIFVILAGQCFAIEAAPTMNAARDVEGIHLADVTEQRLAGEW
jgi:hypothetical protein